MPEEKRKIIKEKVIDGLKARIYDDKTVETDEFYYRIENVIASADLNIIEKLDLGELEERLRNIPEVEVRYQPKQFPGLVLKIHADQVKASALIFSEGKAVLSGIRELDKVEEIVEAIVDILEKAGAKIGKPKVEILNIVALADLKAEVDLELAAIRLEENALYEPEQFPGLIYRLRIVKPECDDRYELGEIERKCIENVAVMLFSSGKAVISGAKSEDVIFRAIKELKERLREEEVLKG